MTLWTRLRDPLEVLRHTRLRVRYLTHPLAPTGSWSLHRLYHLYPLEHILPADGLPLKSSRVVCPMVVERVVWFSMRIASARQWHPPARDLPCPPPLRL